MLVLTRKIGERIRIGDNVQITLIEVESKRAKIGIDAPGDVMVVRDEIDDRRGRCDTCKTFGDPGPCHKPTPSGRFCAGTVRVE